MIERMLGLPVCRQLHADVILVGERSYTGNAASSVAHGSVLALSVFIFHLTYFYDLPVKIMS